MRKPQERCSTCESQCMPDLGSLRELGADTYATTARGPSEPISPCKLGSQHDRELDRKIWLVYRHQDLVNATTIKYQTINLYSMFFGRHEVPKP